MSDPWFDPIIQQYVQRHIQERGNLLRSVTDAVVFGADTEKTGDISGETPVSVRVHGTESKFLVDKQPLADVLTMEEPARVIRGVFADYGLTPADLDRLVSRKDPNERTLLFIVGGLHNRHASVRSQTAHRLAKMGGETAWNALANRAIYDPDPPVRVAAVEALATLDLSRAVPILAVMQSQDRHKDVQAKIEECFAKGIAAKTITEEGIAMMVRPPYRGLIPRAQLEAENTRFLKLDYDFSGAMQRESRERIWK